MPRYESDVWKHYKLLNLTGKKKHTACLYCDREYKNSNPTRCATHLVQCDNCPEDLREKLKGQLPKSVRSKIFHPNYKQFVHRKEVRQNIKTRHMVWEHFKSIKKPGMKKHAICIYCNFEVLEISILRLVDHIKRCEKIPEEIKKKFIKLDLERYFPNNSYDPRIVIKKTFARPKVWEHYNILEQTGYKRHASCKYCGVEYKCSNATRLVVHLCRCVNCPESVKEKFMYGYHMNIDPPKTATSKKLCNRPAVNPHLTRANRAATAGKPASDIWQYFSIISEVGYKKHGSCIYCGKEYKHCNATRLLKHIVVECDECPVDVKKNYLSDVSGSESDDETMEPPSPVPNNLGTTIKIERHSEHEDETMQTSAANHSIDPLENIETTYEKNIANCTSQNVTDNDKTDRALARAIFASGLPNNILESRYWKRAIHLLKPNYNIPSSQDIKCKLFDDDCSRLDSEIETEIRNASTLSITFFIEEINIKEYLLCYIAMTPKPVCCDVKLMKKCNDSDIQNLEETKKIINNIGSDKIVTVIYEKIPHSFKTNQNILPNVVFTQCFYSTLYSWYEKLIRDPATTISSHDLKIHITFLKETIFPVLNSPEDDSYIKLISSLKIPSEENVDEYYSSFKLFLDHKDSINMLALRFKRLDYYSALSIGEQSWKYHLRTTEILEAINEALEEARSEKTVISDVPAIFAQLMVNLEKESHDDFMKITLEHCREDYVKPIHLAANLLDPRYLGCSLSDKEIGDAMTFLSDYATAYSDSPGVVMKNVADFKTRTGFFGKIDAVWNSVHLVEPRVWWQSFCSHLKLTAVAVRLLSTPCSIPERTKMNISQTVWANEQDKEQLIKHEKSRLNYYFKNKEHNDDTNEVE